MTTRSFATLHRDFLSVPSVFYAYTIRTLTIKVEFPSPLFFLYLTAFSFQQSLLLSRVFSSPLF